MTAALPLVLLLGVLGFVAVRPRGVPDAGPAVSAALLLIATGLLPWRDAWSEIGDLAPTLGFLAGMLALAQTCSATGVFQVLGERVGWASGGRAGRLLGLVFLAAAGVTAALSLDTTVVLLTPVVIATVARMQLPPRPHVYACTHLANSASLLLPVSNLTNLLAFPATGLTFLGFAARMALPWALALAVEYAVFVRFFAADLVRLRPVRPARPVRPGPVPRVPFIVLALTLLALALTSPLAVPPYAVALTGAGVLAAYAVTNRRQTLGDVTRSVRPMFLLFVLGLGLVVRALVDAGADGFARALLPHGSTYLALLGVAAVAAVTANLLNNIPAVLLLLPVSSGLGPATVLATLIGVGIGPNLTYTGSLATLLWRRILHEHDQAPVARDFLLLGLLTVPAGLALAAFGLWLSLGLVGG